MLMRTDPFRELDRLPQQFFGTSGTSTWPAVMPMDAYRSGNEYVVQFDLPGVAPDSIDLGVESDVLTVKAERHPSHDTDHIQAHYEAGVLTLRVPIAERAKPRKIMISGGSEPEQINA